MTRHPILGATLAVVIAAPFAASPSMAATQVDVTVAVTQPGFYGRIQIGELPPPVVIYPQPVIVQPMPPAVERHPIYLRVPPGHAKNWARHCHRYHACGQPTYFVQDDWYERVYLPAHSPHPGAARRDRGRGHGHGHGRHDD